MWKRKWNVVLNAQIVLILLFAVAAVGCVGPGGQPAENGVLVCVHVLADHPAPGSGYELREGEPKNVGVYEFYLKKPGLPGSGAFKKLDSIPLNRLNEAEFYGEKLVKRIDSALCVGYPSTNIIDGKTCVEIDQGQDEVDITVHYWKTRLGIL